MNITVNGKTREVAAGTTVQGLLQELGMQEERVAVELNRDILPRDRFAETRLADGDRLEIVHFVGGG